MRDEELQRELTVTLKADRPAASAPAKQPKRKHKKLDLLAVPDDEPETVSDVRPLAPKRRQTETDEHVPQQLAMFWPFSMRCWHDAATTATVPV